MRGPLVVHLKLQRLWRFAPLDIQLTLVRELRKLPGLTKLEATANNGRLVPRQVEILLEQLGDSQREAVSSEACQVIDRVAAQGVRTYLTSQGDIICQSKE